MQDNIQQRAEVNGTEVLDHVPEGWRVIGGANMAPNGYRFINNNKSRWSGQYKHALVSEEVACDWWRDNT